MYKLAYKLNKELYEILNGTSCIAYRVLYPVSINQKNLKKNDDLFYIEVLLKAEKHSFCRDIISLVKEHHDVSGCTFIFTESVSGFNFIDYESNYKNCITLDKWYPYVKDLERIYVGESSARKDIDLGFRLSLGFNFYEQSREKLIHSVIDNNPISTIDSDTKQQLSEIFNILKANDFAPSMQFGEELLGEKLLINQL